MRLRATLLVLLAFLVSASISLPPAVEAAPKKFNFNVVPISIDSVTTGDLTLNQLIANIQVGTNTVPLPLILSTTPNATQAACPILNLELGPIHLDVLGLVVDTSAICLDITAEPGAGNLLGNLLCGIANLLNQGGTLAALTPDQLTMFTDALTDLLNDVLAQATAASAVANASCDILNLALGPLDLNLLGLGVHLDNCANGPVTVDVTAEPGPGNLLGNLLCGLTGLLDNNSRAKVELLRQISLLITQLLQ
jgi:hypothetical protein